MGAAELRLGNLFEVMAAGHPDRRVVEEHGTGVTRTFAEAAERVAAMAGGIQAQAAPGDRVVVATPNDYDLFLLCLAAVRAGMVAVPVNPQMREAEIDHVVTDSGAALVIRTADEVLGPPLTAAVDVGPDDVAAIFYTSGTTGKPKGAQLTQQALLGNAASLRRAARLMRNGEVVCGLPIAHIAGFGGMLMFAALGIRMYLLPRFRPDDALDAIETRRSNAFVGVPAMYRMMLEAGAADRDLRSVRLWASGADAVSPDIVNAFKSFGATFTAPILGRPVGQAFFIDGYGMVELSGGVAIHVSPPFVDLPMLPMPGCKLKVVGDDGDEVPVGEVGELVVKAPGMLKGYHGNEEASREVLTKDGWLRTGDLARRRRFGQVSFAGRIKHVIKHGGYSVFAVEVETTLEEHPDVAEAVVVGLPDERKGQVPAAVVRPAGTKADAGAIQAWAREHMSDYKWPRQIRFVDELPRTATDKVRKDELLALFDDAEGAQPSP
jgi:long-chain acyl-CoA synthetase